MSSLVQRERRCGRVRYVGESRGDVQGQTQRRAKRVRIRAPTGMPVGRPCKKIRVASKVSQVVWNNMSRAFFRGKNSKLCRALPSEPVPKPSEPVQKVKEYLDASKWSPKAKRYLQHISKEDLQEHDRAHDQAQKLQELETKTLQLKQELDHANGALHVYRNNSQQRRIDALETEARDSATRLTLYRQRLAGAAQTPALEASAGVPPRLFC